MISTSEFTLLHHLSTPVSDLGVVSALMEGGLAFFAVITRRKLHTTHPIKQNGSNARNTILTSVKGKQSFSKWLVDYQLEVDKGKLTAVANLKS